MLQREERLSRRGLEDTVKDVVARSWNAGSYHKDDMARPVGLMFSQSPMAVHVVVHKLHIQGLKCNIT